MQEIIDAALAYAAHGWHVFPCKPHDKTPITPHGVKDACADADTIHNWWKQWPGANIGLACGPSELVVVDLDSAHGGLDTWAELRRVHAIDDATVTSLTGGGGQHLIFRAPPGVDIHNSAGKLGPGVDVRANGGYVVIPPSVHPNGKAYEWEASGHPDDLDPAPFPDALLRLLQEPPTKIPVMVTQKMRADLRARGLKDQDIDKLTPVKAWAILNGLGATIPNGTRNDTLTSLAGVMRRRGMSPDAITAALLAENQAKCDPPLSAAEVETIARSVSQYPPAPPAASGLPEILTTNRPLRTITDESMQVLTAANAPPVVFVRSSELVRILTDEKGRPLIESLSDTMLRGRLARTADFLRVTRDGLRHVTPPEAVTRDILALGAWPFPPIDAVVETPVLRLDGTVLNVPGYDAATRLVYAPGDNLHVGIVPDSPTRADVENALGLIDEAIGDFPYADVFSKAGALAVMFTPIVRPAIRGPVPLALIDAPQAGTGKSLLADLTALIATGRRGAMMSAPANDEEWGKKITAALRDGSTVITIDNVEQPLFSANLAAALTADVWKDRILGLSEMITLPQRASWIATGNNIRLRGDLPRRCYWIRLDAQMSQPWRRSGFKHPNLIEWVTDYRGELVTSLLTIARAWYADGRPSRNTPIIGGFESWCRTIDGILAHAGVIGFLGNLEEMYAKADEESLAWESFLAEWQNAYGSDSVLVATVYQDILRDDYGISKRPDLRDALPDDLADALEADKAKKRSGGFQRRLGAALAKREGRRYGDAGLHLMRAGDERHRKNATWKVESAVCAVSAVSVSPQVSF